MNFIRKILNQIRSSDVFGDPILFTFKGHETPKTIIGGIFSSILIIAMIVLFSFDIQDIILKKNPTISAYMEYQEHREAINLSSMPFAIALTDKRGNIYNKDIYFKATYEIVTAIEGKIIPEKKILDLINCSPSHFPLINSTEFQNRGLSKFLCIKDQNFTIYGFLNEKTFASLSFTLYLCNPEDKSCDPLEKREVMRNYTISNYLHFIIQFQNYVYNIGDYASPVVPYIENFGIHYDVDKYKFSHFLIANSSLITDDGFIGQHETTRTILTWDQFSNDFSPLSPSSEYVNIDLKIHPSNKRLISRRVYNKLPSVLADILALYEYLKMGIKLFIVIFANTKRNIKLLNTIYEFDFDEKIKEKKKNKVELIKNNYINKNQFSLNNHDNNPKFNKLRSAISLSKLKNKNSIKTDGDIFKNYSDQSNVQNNFIKSGDENNVENIDKFPVQGSFENKNVLKPVKINKSQEFYEIKKKIEKKKELHFKFIEIIKIHIASCCLKNKNLKRKYELYKLGEEKLEEKMEIGYVMNKLGEVEKLKTVLLSRDQLCVFNILSRELCSLHSKNMKRHEFNKLEKFQKSKKKLNKAFTVFQEKLKRTLQSDEVDQIDLRLISQLPKELKEYLIL